MAHSFVMHRTPFSPHLAAIFTTISTVDLRSFGSAAACRGVFPYFPDSCSTRRPVQYPPSNPTCIGRRFFQTTTHIARHPGLRAGVHLFRFISLKRTGGFPLSPLAVDFLNAFGIKKI
jgi:hypothetical protein